jgi:hypothetical protein
MRAYEMLAPALPTSKIQVIHRNPERRIGASTRGQKAKERSLIETYLLNHRNKSGVRAEEVPTGIFFQSPNCNRAITIG